MTNQSDWEMTLSDSFDNDETVLSNEVAPAKGISRTGSQSYAQGSVIKDLYVVKSEPYVGGMGSVICVHHTTWNIDLAMKQPHIEGLTQTKKELFVHECEAWINLGLHPNIVPCYYVRNIDGIPSIFSEWMDAGSVKDQIVSRELYQGTKDEILCRILDIMIQSAQGLQFAHSKGLIHQDIKPANILCGKDGSVKIADFGLANVKKLMFRTNAENQAMTVLAENGGYTPQYCSPEQLNGHPVSVRSDIWNWAVTALEMLIGECRWNNGVIAGAACKEYLANGVVEVPEKLKALLAKCFEMEESNRPHDFSVILSSLLQIYKEITKSEYAKTYKENSLVTAEFLNNKALSYMDLNKMEQAQKTWQEALQLAPQHSASNYNYTLFQWRVGIITDLDAIARIRNLYQANNDDLLAVGLAEMLCESGRYNEVLNISTYVENEKLKKLKEFCAGERNVLEKIRTINLPNQKKMRCFLGHGGTRIDKSDGSMLACDIIDDGNIFYRLKRDDDTFVLEKEIHYPEKKQEINMFVYINQGKNLLVHRVNNTLDILDAKTYEYIETVLDSSQNDIRMIYRMIPNEDSSLVVLECVPDIVGSKKLSIQYHIFDMINKKILTSMVNDSITCFFAKDNVLAMTIDHKHCQIEIKGNGEQNRIDFAFDFGRRIRNFTGSLNEYQYHTENTALSICEYPAMQVIHTMNTEEYVYPMVADVDNKYILIDEGDQIIQRAFFGKTYKSEWMLSRIISANDAKDYDIEFKEIYQKAENAYKCYDYQLALQYIEQAASIPGYNHNRDLMDLNRKVGKYCVIKGFRNLEFAYRNDLFNGVDCLEYETISFVMDKGRRFIQCQKGRMLDTVLKHEYDLKNCEIPTVKGLFDVTMAHRHNTMILANRKDSLENYLDTDKQGFKQLLNVFDDGSRTKIITSPEMKMEDIKPTKDSVVFHDVDVDENILITVQKSGSIKKWDLAKGTIIQKYDDNSGIHIYECALSQNGEYLVIRNVNKLAIWKTDPMSLMTEIDLKDKQVGKYILYGDTICHMTFMNNNDLLTCGQKGQIIIWDILAGKPKKTYLINTENSLATERLSITGWIESFSLSENQRFVLLAGKQFFVMYDLHRETEYVFPIDNKTYSGSCSFTADKDIYVSIVENNSKDKQYFNLIDWEYSFPGWSDWDDKALPIVKKYISTHKSKIDIDELVLVLQNNELGWIRREGVEKKIKELTGNKDFIHNKTSAEYGLSIEQRIVRCAKICKEDNPKERNSSASITGSIRFNGLYCYIKDKLVYAFRFYEDNTVISTTVAGRDGEIAFPKENWFNRENTNLNHGLWIIAKNNIMFTIVSEKGKVDYWGKIQDNALILSNHSHINGHESSGMKFIFYPFSNVPAST